MEMKSKQKLNMFRTLLCPLKWILIYCNVNKILSFENEPKALALTHTKTREKNVIKIESINILRDDRFAQCK